MPTSIRTVLTPRESDIGNLVVRRVLPARAARLVGPFIFFDHMGPAVLPPGVGVDVRPHPHIGLATVTYLFEGSLMHCDSIGSKQKIVPGDVNWMTAGRCVVHSERTPDEDRPTRQLVHGIQTWVALPLEHEDVQPDFVYHPAATLPEFESGGVRIWIIAGHAFGYASPVTTFSPTLYAAAEFAAGGALVVEPEHEERGVYLVDGDLAIDGETLSAGTMAVLEPGSVVRLSTTDGTRHAARRRASSGRALHRLELRIQFAQKDRVSEGSLGRAKARQSAWRNGLDTVARKKVALNASL